MKFQRKEIFYWSLFFFYGLFILATLPYIVPIQRALGRKLQDYLLLFIIITITLVFLILLAHIFFIKRERRVSKYLGVIGGTGLIGLTVYFLILRTNYSAASKAVEFIHFFEYGLLSYLAFIALRCRINNLLIYVWGVIVVSCFGYIDEGIQWVIESRTGELKDALTNVACAVTFQIFISQVSEPVKGFKKIEFHDFKLLLKGLSVFLVIITLFTILVNTGFEVFDHEVGYFKSKFTRDNLLSMKEERSQIIMIPNPKATQIVIKPDYWSITDFYAQEAKYHIKFRNDLLKDKHYRSAYCEELILEKYYEPVMLELNQKWPFEMRKEIFFKIPDRKNSYFYHSPLRENIITGVGKFIILFSLIILSIVPIIIDIMTDKKES